MLEAVVKTETSQSGCEITRSFTMLGPDAYAKIFLGCGWRKLFTIGCQTCWMNLTQLQIVVFVEGDIITYEAEDADMLWVEAALLRIFAQDQ